MNISKVALAMDHQAQALLAIDRALGHLSESGITKADITRIRASLRKAAEFADRVAELMERETA